MKALIVDDEPNVRAGMKMLIPWQNYDFEIVGEAADGPSGLEKIISLDPELVLMDIRMPGLSGLEVVEQARKQGYKGRFIITTGYSEFEYAKKAIHLGVSTYLLKPIDEDELMEAIDKIRYQIIKERKLQDEIEASQLYIKKSMMVNQVELRMAMSQGFKSLIECSKVYKQTEKLLEQYFLFPKERLLKQEQTGDRVDCLDEKRGQEDEDLGKILYNLLQVGDKKKLKEALETFRSKLQQEKVSKQRIISISTQALLKAVQQLADTYRELTQIISNGETMIEQIYKCKDIDEIMTYMEIELFKIVDAFCVNTPEHTMQKIVYYINNNYGSELKLEYLAELFNYNSAYLGKSFRNYTGKSFNVYLEQLRINKAKELLLDGHMKVYEIGKIVGYKHMDYFYSKFKKYVGISPLEYKKAMEVGKISD